MAELPKRQLGRTGLQVTMLGYGAMELRGAPRGRDVTDIQAETILNAVLDAGINYIDTSIDYGVSEERIGRYIGDRRSEYYLASKCGCLVGAPPAPRGQTSPHVFTRDNILAGVEQSLLRMRTDYLDVLQFHISPSRQTLEEHGALETVLELKRAGTVRLIGMSGTLPNLTDHIAMGVFDVFQIPYSAVEREHEAPSPRPPRREPASSSGAVRPRARQPRASKTGCNGNGGSRWPSLTCSTACRPWSSSCASPSPIRTCTRTSSGRSIPPISGTMSMSCGRARCRPTCTPKPSAASRLRVQSREVANQHVHVDTTR